jgi:hypothetical protein
MERVKRLAAVLILATAATAACSSGSGASATSAVHNAVNVTLGAGSVKESVSSLTPTASATSKSSATGTYAFGSHSGEFTVTTDAFLGTFDVVVVGGTLYLKLPPALVLVAGGKKWASADLAHPPTVPGAGNLIALAGATDPGLAVTGLQEGLTSAKKVGRATVDGVATTQYNAQVTFPKSPSALGASERTLIGGSSENDDVFVGPDGKLVRLARRVAISAGATETLTVDYSNYGAPVSVSAPPADQTADAAKLLGQ